MSQKQKITDFFAPVVDVKVKDIKSEAKPKIFIDCKDIKPEPTFIKSEPTFIKPDPSKVKHELKFIKKCEDSKSFYQDTKHGIKIEPISSLDKNFQAKSELNGSVKPGSKCRVNPGPKGPVNPGPKSPVNSDSKCPVCSKVFAFNIKLNNHKKTQHPEIVKNIMSCSICSLRFVKKNSLALHMKVKHFDGKSEQFECDSCGRVFSSKTILRQHMKTHMPAIDCKLCGAKIKLRTVHAHMRLAHATNEKFQCKICSKSFKALQLLRGHESAHNKKHECETCGRKFRSSYTLRCHINLIHKNLKSFKCQWCNKRFTHNGKLKMHLRTHEWNYQVVVLQCPKCSHQTESKKGLELHLKSHERREKIFATMKNPQKCSLCPTMCRHKWALAQHMSVVHPKVMFQCDLCGMYIKSKGDVKKHIGVHLGRMARTGRY